MTDLVLGKNYTIIIKLMNGRIIRNDYIFLNKKYSFLTNSI